MLVRCFLLIFIITKTLSCEKVPEDVEPQKAYYQFTDEDLAIIPNYEQGDIFILKNQDQEVITFYVYSSRYEKRQRVRHGLFASTEKYFYDYYSALIDTYIDHKNVRGSITFRRYPIDVDQARSNYTQQYPDKLYGTISFPLQNVMGRLNFIDDYEKIIEMNYNGISYSNVRVFKTGSMDPYITPGDVKKTAHTFYYAHGVGFIGFDDIYGNEWRLH